MTEPTFQDESQRKEMLTHYLVENFGGEENIPQRWVVNGREEGPQTFEFVTLHEVGLDGRSKLWISPLSEIDSQSGIPQTVFGKAMYVTGDPNNTNPARPEGHIHAENTNPTTRWMDDELSRKLSELAEQTSINWIEVRDDGGSIYYEYVGEDGSTYIKQVSKDSGRTLIGLQKVQELEAISSTTGQKTKLKYKLVKRLVVKGGANTKYSPEGSTNYEFGGFELPEA